MYYNIFLDISQLSPPATWSSSKNSQTYVGWYTLSPRHCESHLNIVTLLPLTSCLWMALLSTSSVGSFCSVGEDSIFSFFSVFLVSFFTLGLDIWSKSAPLSFIFNISNLVWLHLFWFVFNRTVIYLEYQRLVYASPLVFDLELFWAEWHKLGGHNTGHMLSSDYHSFIVWSWSGTTLSLGFVVA